MKYGKTVIFIFIAFLTLIPLFMHANSIAVLPFKISAYNKNLKNQENYDNALKKKIEMEYLDLKKENLIKHYEKKDVGYVLL